MSETTQTAIYYNGNWYGRSGNTDALDARITQTANNIASRQISDTASKLITVGEYFTDKLGKLCVCDVQIASGGSIVVGSNCHVVSEGLGNELGSNRLVSGGEITSYTPQTLFDLLSNHDIVVLEYWDNANERWRPSIVLSHNEYTSITQRLMIFAWDNSLRAYARSATSNYVVSEANHMVVVMYK
jgi:hypothetical protein